MQSWWRCAAAAAGALLAAPSARAGDEERAAPPPIVGAPAAFEDLLRDAPPADAATLARSILAAAADAPPAGARVAIETDRVTIAPGPTPTSLVLRVDAALFVPAYDTRLDAADPRSPVGPLVTAGVPAKIEPPDFEKSMTYRLHGARAAAETTLTFKSADAVAAFRLGNAEPGALHAQLVVVPGAPWRATVLDPWTTKTTIAVDGKASTKRGTGPRKDTVAGISCAVLGWRIYSAAGGAAGTLVAAKPASRTTKIVALAPAPPADRVSEAGVEAPPAAGDGALAAALAPSESPELGACRASRDAGDLRGALISCTKALEKNPLDGEADAILRALPRTVPPEALRTASAKVAPAVRRCAPPGTEPVKVLLHVSPAGEVLASLPEPPYTGTAIGKCVADAAKAIVFPPFAATTSLKIAHTFAVW